MVMLFDIIYYATLLFVPLVPYLLFFKRRSADRFHTNRDFFYFIKLALAKQTIIKYQSKYKQSLDQGRIDLLEIPKEIPSEKYSDSHFIYGVDQKGNNFSLRFTIHSNLIADVFLCLRLSNAVYSFPGGKIQIYRIANGHWKTKDLQIEILEPFKRLRIIFNGLLTDGGNVRHVQMNFLWKAAGYPLFYPQDAATGLLADCLAREPWRDGDWISLLGDERGYEQMGALKGYVSGDSFNRDLILDLPSCRTRFWCSDEKKALNRSIHLFVVTEHGDLINLWVKNLKNGVQELQYGSVIQCDGIISPICKSDVRITSLAPNKETLPGIFLVHIQSVQKVYRIVFHIKKKQLVMTDELSNVSGECDVNDQQGKSLVEFWYGGKPDLNKQLPPLLLTEDKTREIPDCYVTNLNDENARMVHLTGGKGCSLALLTSIKTNDFIVPNGFIVTVNAFNKQIQENVRLGKAVKHLDDICCGRSHGNLQQACADTNRIFRTTPILPEIQEAVISTLISLKHQPRLQHRFAVRSSGLGEDSAQLSAAGQNDTYLGCTTSEEVLQAVASCWASLFSYQSVKYRHQHGSPVATQMAVVVQKMVPAECAGVLFTCHPTDGNPARILITANHGLGETVVSGKSEPDSFTVARTWKGEVGVVDRQVGGKKTVIEMAEVGVREVDGKGEELCLTDEQVLKLARVGVMLEERCGGARDIEWAFFQGRLYLLQARPVTTLTRWSNFELSHEFDVATLTENSVFTIANTGEVLPGAITTLTVSTLLPALDYATSKAVGMKDDAYALRGIKVFQSHLFLDVIGSLHRRVDKEITLVNKALDLSVCGHPILTKHIHSLSLKRFGVHKGLAKLKEMFKAAKQAWFNEQNTELCTNLARTSDFDFNTDSDSIRDVYNKIAEGLTTMAEIILYHCQTTRTSVTFQLFSMLVLAEKNEDFTVDHYGDVAILLASCDDVISAEIPNTLTNIHNILVTNQKASEFLKVGTTDGREWLQVNCKEASVLFEAFLQKHGHRGVREFDMYTKPWGDNPSEVIRMIQTNLKMATLKKTKVPKSVDEVIAELKTPKKLLTRPILKILTTKNRRAVSCREQTKSEVIRFVDKTRKAYNYLAARMTLKGLIPAPDLIFFLTHYEIGQIIDGIEESPALITKAFQRKKLYPKCDALKFPEVCYGIPRPENREFVRRPGSGKIICEGTPACNGIVTARACVITDLNETDQLNEDDILITYATDIGWSPYFPMISGVITELGGLVSHGAVIAREYGLPCIVGAKGATELFKTGDIITLSGERGTIELIK